MRDFRGAAHVPVTEPAPAVSRLQRIEGTATVSSADPTIDVAELQRVVHERCPVANMISASGCVLDISWAVAET